MTEQLDLTKFAELGNKALPMLDELRERDPIYWSELNSCWIVTDHSAVLEGFSGRLPTVTYRHEILQNMFPNPGDFHHIESIVEIFPHMMTTCEPARHLQLKRLLTDTFSRSMAERYRPTVRAKVNEVLSRIGSQEIDFASGIAREIAAPIILQVMGLSDDYLKHMERWTRTLNEGLNSAPNTAMISAANDVLGELKRIFHAEIEKRKSQPAGDFISNLIAAREGTDKLTDAELVAQLVLVLTAGHDTIMNTMSLSIAKLADDPAAVEYIRSHPDQLDDCIMELMRIIGMSASMQRIAKQDFDWRGRKIKEGDVLFLMIAAANRDPSVFRCPSELDFARSQSANVTFAPGPHFCIGRWFAKMSLSEFFPAFFERFGSWELLDGELKFTSITGFRAPTRVPLRLHLRS